MPTIIVMPQLGESVAEGVIGKWLKNEGDQVARDEPIVEVITDKVNAEIPSPVAGILEKITQPEGATVAVGHEIAVIGDEGGQTAQPAELVASAGSSQPTPAPHASGDNGQQSYADNSVPAGARAPAMRTTLSTHGGNGRSERVRTSPLVRRLAEQHSVSLAEVPGTGIGGRVSKHDILAYVEQSQGARSAPSAQTQPAIAAESIERPAPNLPAAATATAAPPLRAQLTGTRELSSHEELVPITPLRKMIADRMVQSIFTIPHATTMTEVDMTRVVAFREEKKDEFRRLEDVPLSYVAFVIKATVEALKDFPLVNAEWAGDSIILKKDININVAVDAPEGLTTPVIHHADDRSLAGLSKAIYDLAIRARGKKLRIEDMQGGTFTVNNTGALGSVSGVSIINYPQGGILAAGTIVKRPVVFEQDGQDLIAVRSMMNLSFSFDHRLLDGGYAAGFVQAVKEKLEGWPIDYPLY